MSSCLLMNINDLGAMAVSSVVLKYHIFVETSIFIKYC